MVKSSPGVTPEPRFDPNLDLLATRDRVGLYTMLANFSVGLFSSAAAKKGLRGRARCVVPCVSAAVAIAAWLGRALAVGVRKL